MQNAKKFHADQMAGKPHWTDMASLLYVEMKNCDVARLLMVTSTGFILAGRGSYYPNKKYAIDNSISEVSGEILLHVPLADCENVIDAQECLTGKYYTW